jgi:adenylate cyclase
MKRWFEWLLPTLLLLSALLVRAFEPALLEDIRLKVFDLYQRLKPRPYEDAPVRMVDIDEESLKRVGQWPWPRTRIADLVGKLHQAGARVIVFDAIFPEPDRTSPKNILPLWQSPAVKTLETDLAGLPDHDRVLADALPGKNVVTGFAVLFEANENRPPVKTEFSYVGESPAAHLPPFHGAVVDLPEIEGASLGNGCINTIQERDGVVRRVPFVFSLEGVLYPSLVAGALNAYQDQAGFLIRYSGDSEKKRLGERDGITRILGGDLDLPVDGQGRIWLYDAGYVPGRFIPAWKVFEGEIAREALRGKIIYLGTSAVGLKDLRITPINPAAAGTEIHVQLTEQILLGRFLDRPDWVLPAEVLYFTLASLLLIFATPRAGALWNAGTAVLAVTAVIYLSWAAFSRRGLLVDPFFPSAGIACVYLTSSLIHFLRTEAEKRQVRSAFGRYLSPVLVEQLARHPEKLKLGGEMRNVTLLFSDIRGFTTISEQFNAEELTHFMNSYLTPMTDLIMQQKGTIDKYIGDCIMAFWNAPLDDPKHASNACHAALQMRSLLIRWNREFKQEMGAKQKPFHPIDIGIGINTGDCCVGNMGSHQRFDYSVLGDEVNLASRLEGQSKTYGVDIVIGANTFEKIKTEAYAALELDLLRVKGKKKPVRIFGLLGGAELKEADSFEKLSRSHVNMLLAYRAQEWDDALQLLETCLSFDTGKTRLRAFYELYGTRIRDYQASPPDAEWDGVTVALTK